jgi:hypothetical protein
MAHAARSRRWRQRCRERAQQQAVALEATALDGGLSNFVTHQGSPPPPPDAPLPPSDERADAVIDTGTSLSTGQCRRCAAPLAPWVRQGFLRHGMRRWPARVIDPGP